MTLEAEAWVCSKVSSREVRIPALGNDYKGWEFYKDTRVLYGSVLVDGNVHHHPSPTRMIWRPDKMICEYQIEGRPDQGREIHWSSNDAAAIYHHLEQTNVALRFEGRSLLVRHSVSSTAEIRYEPSANTILISEGGNGDALGRTRSGPERIGPIVYQGMTTALSCSQVISPQASSFSSRGSKGESKSTSSRFLAMLKGT